MKAYWITPGPGGTKVELRETATPEPRPGEILVRVRPAALNRGELLGGTEGAPATAGGGECTGDVVKVGPAAITFMESDRRARVHHLDAHDPDGRPQRC
jgi:NADPH:quinone reductase-like Zn-dependent oxidoreductase